MNRIDTEYKAEDLFGAGKHGFKDGDLPNAIVATRLNAEWFNAQQEEKMTVIEGAGVAPQAGVYTQLLRALKRFFGGNVISINAAASPFALTADHAGLVKIDAVAGNVVVNLPAANVLAGLPYEFRRVDASANVVTVNRAGADTIDEGGTSFTLAAKAVKKIRSDGATSWSAVTPASASTAETDAGTDDSKFVTPKNLRFGFAVSLTSNGYIALPSWLGGVIIQWGLVVANTPAVAGSFPITFPNALLSMAATSDNSGGAASSSFPTKSSSGFTAFCSAGSLSTSYIAIGY